MCQQFQTDIYFLIQRTISTFLIKYYGHKGDTQIVLIKDVNATDMKSNECLSHNVVGTMDCRPVLIHVILMSIISERYKQLMRIAKVNNPTSIRDTL